MKRFSRCVAVTLAAVLFAASIGQLPAAANPNRQPQAAADVELTILRATISSHGGLVEWASQFDNRILGFNVFRLTNGRRVQLNPSLIAGPTMLVQNRTQRFAWFDPAGTNDSIYEVEAVNLRGESWLRTSAKPIGTTSLPAYNQSPLMADLGKDRARQTGNATWDDDLKASVGSELVAGDTATTLAQQWSIANQPALKIGIRTDGWYRITQPQLLAAGFDVSRDARNLQLFNEGNEIALSVSRNAGVLTQADFVEFWGQGLDRPTTDTRVYWLLNGQQPGKRMSLSGNLRPDSAPSTGSVMPGPTPAVGYTNLTVNLSWNFGGSLPSEILAKLNETASVASAVSVAVLSAPERARIEADPVKGIEAKVPQPPLSSEPFARPVPSAEPKLVTKPPSLAAAKPARRLESAKSRKPHRRRAPRKYRSKLRLRAHNQAMDAGSILPAFTYSTEYSAHNIYYTTALNGDRENFFGPGVFGSGTTITLKTRNVERTSTAPVQLTMSLQGVTLGGHQVNVSVNGTPAGSISFSDQSSTTQTLLFPGAWLIDGDNAIKLMPTSSTADTTLVDYLRVTYSHSFRAEDDALQFSLKATQSARVDGFTSADIRVVDISDPTSVQIVRPIIDGSGGSFAATVPAGERGKARRFIALPAARISQPAWLALNQPSTLNINSNGADLLIITYKDFAPSLQPLVAQRQAQGYAVRTVDIDDVYDEFSFGEHTPQAIRDFMSLAKNTWTHAPSYLLLVGDASLDPRNRLGAGYFDFMPTKLVDTGTPGDATALETASDDWLTDFDGNGIADIATGRLPVRTVAEANLLISKIVNYSPANAGNKALLVADTQGGYYFNFEAANDQVATTLPAGMTVQKVYRRLQPSDADARTNIIANLNSGQTVTVYSGHGNVNIWGGSIFSATDAAALTNGNRLSFVVVMDCLNGYFADPSLKSLAESFLSAPSGGAVASFASSGLTIPDGQHAMGLEMFHLLYSGGSITIGDASRQAKLATNDMDVRRTWILLGDPTLKIR